MNPVILAMMLVIFGPTVAVIYTVVMFIFTVGIGLLLERTGYQRYLKAVAVEGKITQSSTKLQQVVRFAFDIFRQMVPYLLRGAAIGVFIYGFLPAD